MTPKATGRQSPRSPQLAYSIGLSAGLFALTLALCTSVSEAGRGRWSPPQTWSEKAVHMALVPGDGSPFFGHVIWWVDEDATEWRGGQWGWKADNDAVDCSSYPAAKFVDLGLANPGSDIFCSGLTHLQDGRLLVVGGSELKTEYGIRSVTAFTADSDSGAGSWNAQDPMYGARWYPTATAMSDGRVLATSGSTYPRIFYFGGLKNGEATPSDDSLYRFGLDEQTVWDAPAASFDTLHWGRPLYGHSYTVVPGATALCFGGRGRNGQLSKRLWFENENPASHFSDFAYDWVEVVPDELSSFDPRGFHSAVPCDTTMIVWGGIRSDGSSDIVTNQLWRLRRIWASTHWTWELLTQAGSSVPGARFGHKAVYDDPEDPSHRRMIVFGGAPSTTADPVDTTVWALELPHAPASTATWSKLPVVDPGVHPPALYDHSLEYIPGKATFSINGATYTNVKSALLFGGRGASGAAYNDLWRLVFVGSDSVRWIHFTVADSVPTRRYAHSASWDYTAFKLYVFGGLNAANAAVGDTMWRAEFKHDTVTWRAFPGRPQGTSTAWQAMVLANSVFTRLPEIFYADTTSTHQWSHGSSFLLQNWYPQMFVMPNGKVFCAGPGDSSYSFDPADEQWSRYPAVGDTSRFVGGSAVMYLPGKVMKCGSRDIEGSGAAVETTKTINLLGTPDTLWHSSGAMAHRRVNMNLTLLPTGKVLVTGGTDSLENGKNINPQRRPEIWDPAANSGVGAWSGGSETSADTLSMSTVNRGYHSTALLLPDARVLCAGGFGENIGEDPNKGDVFCPPYLFTDSTSSTLATRPTHTRPPAGHASWGKIFTVATSRAATINSVCLLKPGATTHAFDMDQRYVPLSFVADTILTKRLFVTAPADSNYAPPGDYMLFMLDNVSSTATSVPSIATWLKVNRSSGRDSADVTPPGVVDDLTIDVSHTSVILGWTAPADDTTLEASGPKVQSYDVRRKSIAMVTESDWTGGTSVGGPTTIESVGNPQVKLVTGLSACTVYHFGARATDDNVNKGVVPPDVSERTLCGGGGGGDAAQLAGGDASASPAGGSPAGGVVIVRTTRTQTGTWRIDARQAATTDGLGLEDSTGMFIQLPNGTGGYKRAMQVLPGAEDTQIGLCALRDGRRVVLAGGYTLKAIASRLHSGSSDYVLTGAAQGSVGNLGAEWVATAGSVTVATGDSLTLTYRADSTTADSAGGWFAIVARVGAGALGARLEHPGGIALPLRFALRQNQPNPFTSATTIRFDLPVGAAVRLELFDAQGRRVSTLANRFYPAGYQSVRWDPSRSDAGHMGPGVYFYRIQAGAFRDRKKMVLLGN